MCLDCLLLCPFSSLPLQITSITLGLDPWSQFSFSLHRYRVNELHNIPIGQKSRFRAPDQPSIQLQRSFLYKETDEGDDLYPDDDGVWHLVHEREGASVRAAPMKHTVRCVGYVIEEQQKPGRLIHGLVDGVVSRNHQALKAQYGDVRRVYKDIKEMAPGSSMTMPDGTVLRANDVVIPSRPGRKVVILGDTCDATAILGLAQGADVLVHEATNSWIPSMDTKSAEEVEMDTILHGHSTPQMAGRFAKACGARRLVLTHFSSRYPYRAAGVYAHRLRQIVAYARQASGLPEDSVVAAHDFLTLSIPRPGYVNQTDKVAPVDEDEETEDPIDDSD